MRTAERIVVGVSGSVNSLAALRWATTEAHLRAAEIWAVHAWSSPLDTMAIYASRRGMLSHEQQREAANKLLAAALCNAWETELDRPVIRGRPILVKGYAIPVLLRYAADADLLVLGRSLRRQEFDGSFLLGMVARTCIANSRCPVVAVAATEMITGAKNFSDSAEM
jgi:nucleotide-binding universal stress UspA family protein